MFILIGREIKTVRTFPRGVNLLCLGGEQVRPSHRHWLNYFAKVLPLVVLAAPLLLAAQALQESNGIIDMDGERFLPENPREKAEWTFARFHYDLDSQFGRFRFQRWAADYPKSDRQFTV